MFLLPENHYFVRDTKLKGRGVYSKKDLNGGMVIGDYLGTITRAEDVPDTDQDFYDLVWNDKASIVANPKKIGVHLLNHSCAANCAMFPYRGHILYFALRKIFAGEELTVEYSLTPPAPDELVLFDTCHCRTPVCRGTMYNSPAVNERYYQFEQKISGNYFRKLPGPFGSELTLLDQYPDTIKDYPVYNLFGSLGHRADSYNDPFLPTISTLRMLIRETGKRLSFPRIHMSVYGIMGELVISTTK